MNLLSKYDERGQLVHQEPVDGLGVVDAGPIHNGATVLLTPMPGYQLNGHPLDCRCRRCRGDLYPGEELDPE